MNKPIPFTVFHKFKIAKDIISDYVHYNHSEKLIYICNSSQECITVMNDNGVIKEILKINSESKWCCDNYKYIIYLTADNKLMYYRKDNTERPSVLLDLREFINTSSYDNVEFSINKDEIILSVSNIIFIINKESLQIIKEIKLDDVNKRVVNMTSSEEKIYILYRKNIFKWDEEIPSKRKVIISYYIDKIDKNTGKIERSTKIEGKCNQIYLAAEHLLVLNENILEKYDMFTLEKLGDIFKDENITTPISAITDDGLYLYLGFEDGDIITLCHNDNFQKPYILNKATVGSIEKIVVSSYLMIIFSNSKCNFLYRRSATPTLINQSPKVNLYVQNGYLKLNVTGHIDHMDKNQKIRYRFFLTGYKFKYQINEWSEYHTPKYFMNEILKVPMSVTNRYNLKLMIEIEDLNENRKYYNWRINTINYDEPEVLQNKIVISYQTIPTDGLKLSYKLGTFDKETQIFTPFKEDTIDVLSTNGLDWYVSVDEEGRIITEKYNGSSFDYIEIVLPKNHPNNFLFYYEFHSDWEYWKIREPKNNEYFIYDLSNNIRCKGKSREEGNFSNIEKFLIHDISKSSISVKQINELVFSIPPNGNNPNGINYILKVDDDGRLYTEETDKKGKDKYRLTFLNNGSGSSIGLQAPNGDIWDFSVTRTGNGRTELIDAENPYAFIMKETYDKEELVDIVRALSNPVSFTISSMRHSKYLLKGHYDKYGHFHRNDKSMLDMQVKPEGLSEELFKSHHHYFNVYVNGLKKPKNKTKFHVDNDGEFSVLFEHELKEDDPTALVPILKTPDGTSAYEMMCDSNGNINLYKVLVNPDIVSTEIYIKTNPEQAKLTGLPIKTYKVSLNDRGRLITTEVSNDFPEWEGRILSTSDPCYKWKLTADTELVKVINEDGHEVQVGSKPGNIITTNTKEIYQESPIEIELNHRNVTDNEQFIAKKEINSEKDIEDLYNGTFRMFCNDLGESIEQRDLYLFLRFNHTEWYTRLDKMFYEIKFRKDDITVQIKNYILNDLPAEVILTTRDVDRTINIKLEKSNKSSDVKPYYYIPLISYDKLGNLCNFYAENPNSFEIIVNGFTLMPSVDYILVNLYLHSHIPTLVLFKDTVPPDSDVEINYLEGDTWKVDTIKNEDNDPIIEITDGRSMFISKTFTVICDGKKLDASQYTILDRKHLMILVPERRNIIIRFNHKNYRNMNKLLETLHNDEDFLNESERYKRGPSQFNGDMYKGIPDDFKTGYIYLIEQFSDYSFKNDKDVIFDCNKEIDSIFDCPIDCSNRFNLDYFNNDIVMDCNEAYDKWNFQWFNDPEDMPLKPLPEPNTQPVLTKQPELKLIDDKLKKVLIQFRVYDKEDVFFTYFRSVDGSEYEEIYPIVGGLSAYDEFNLEVGIHSIKYKICDSDGLSVETDEVVVHINKELNSPPMFNMQPVVLSSKFNKSVHIRMEVSDPEGSEITFMANIDNKGFKEINPILVTGSLYDYKTDLEYGNHDIVFKVVDSNGSYRLSRPLKFSIIENNPLFLVKELTINQIDNVNRNIFMSLSYNDREDDEISTKLYINNNLYTNFVQTQKDNKLSYVIRNIPSGNLNIKVELSDGFSTVDSNIVSCKVDDITKSPEFVKQPVVIYNKNHIMEVTYKISDENVSEVKHFIVFNGSLPIEMKPEIVDGYYKISYQVSKNVNILTNIKVIVLNKYGINKESNTIARIELPPNNPISIQDLLVSVDTQNLILEWIISDSDETDIIQNMIQIDKESFKLINPMILEKNRFKYIIENLSKGEHSVRIKVTDGDTEDISEFKLFNIE